MKAIEETHLTKNELDAIKAAVDRLKEEFPLEKTVVFGSKVRGDHDAYSDIDLLFITTRPLHWKEEKSMVETLFDIGMKFDVIFSPLFATIEEWDGGLFSQFPIYREIVRDGALVA